MKMRSTPGILWRWIKVIWPFLAGATLMVGLSDFSIDILSGSRAYVEGESLWSKAQKMAVLHLNRYAYSHDESDYRAYLKAISVPLGDRKARQELEKSQPDLELARRGFLEGHNHPDDVDGMIHLFRNFKDIRFMRKPIAIWTEGDAQISELIAEAEHLHATIQSGNASNASIQAILERIKQIDMRLTPLEENFSASLSHATRRIEDVLANAMLAITTASIGFGCYFSFAMLARKEAAEAELRKVAAYAAAEHERRESDARIRYQANLLDKARDAIIVRTLDDRLLYWNKGAERLYRFTAEEARHLPVDKLIYPDPAVFRAATDSVMESGKWIGEFETRRSDGTLLAVESHWTLVRDDDGKPRSILSIDSDISERKNAEDDFRKLAFYDPLTRLPNRLLLQDRLKQALACSSHNQCAGALLFIDLDNFKALNDTLGHENGDILLQHVSQRLTHCVRESDTVARLGGDEFVILLADQHDRREDVALRARSVCEKILDHLRQPYTIAGSEQHSAASIGVALFEGRHDTVSELLRRADLAMYQAKGAGRNTVRFFNHDMQVAVSARAALEADLRQGLREHQFYLCYQPQMDEDNQMIGTEALIRWRHPTRGMIAPNRFIPVSEEMGLIEPLGQWVLETACAQLAIWAQKPATSRLSVAVNVSARQVHHEHFVEHILMALDRSGANPERLKLEITESIFLDDVETTIAKMTTLKSKGVCFSLDDFGTGYSSLSYLKRLPLDQLKIDQSFVRDVLTDFNDAAIARTIVILAQSLGLTVIAEGVESEGQRSFLSRNDCHLYQGYLFSPPVPADRLEALMSAVS
jgi:diguanylate cyclase (GGDEF)-like protein/PAS domain S-box-containing protein